MAISSIAVRSLLLSIRFCFFLMLTLITATRADADPLNGSLTPGTSTSGNYESRNVFTNPAALGFQTELNGTSLSGAFAYGFNRHINDDYQGSLSLGYLGLGYEDLNSLPGNYNNRWRRYAFALGVPLSSTLFIGARYALHRSPGDGFDSLDLGLQFRPFSRWAIGLLFNNTTQTTFQGAHQPTQFVLGTSFRPWEPLVLTADIDTKSKEFGRNLGYQGMINYEWTRGATFSAGYHSTYQWQVGLRLNLGNAAIFGMGQPSAAPREALAGFSLTTNPYRSALPASKALKIEIDSSLSEQAVAKGIFGKETPSLVDILKSLDQATKNDEIAMVILHISEFPLGLAAAQELHDAVQRVRHAGKRIEVFLGNSSLRELMIASASHRIHMEPTGELTLLGPKLERYFVKGTLDKLGIEGEFLARGEYKSAPEMFTRKDTSAINREAELEMLKQVETAYLDLLKKDRDLTEAESKGLTNTAVFSARDALASRLIDDVGSYSHAMETIHDRFLIVETTTEQRETLALPPRISVITAQGDILHKNIRLLSLSGHPMITPRRIQKQFQLALSDPRTRAIVLRVDSPGGEVLASDEIASMIKTANRTKPVIVSMGDMAASGGYMISAPASRIFAEPLTLTGSIGVFVGKFNLAGLYQKIGIHKEILTRSPYATLKSEDRPWSEEERRIMLRQLNDYYEGFVEYVADLRHLSASDAEASAKGRVWLGQNAKNRKLVDELGGVMDAIGYAAKQENLSEGEYDVELMPEYGGLFPFMGDEGFVRGDSPTADLALSLFSTQALRELLWMSSLQSNPFLYVAPISKIE